MFYGTLADESVVIQIRSNPELPASPVLAVHSNDLFWKTEVSNTWFFLLRNPLLLWILSYLDVWCIGNDVVSPIVLLCHFPSLPGDES